MLIDIPHGKLLGHIDVTVDNMGINFHIPYSGKFRGVQFSWFSRISGYPRKLDPQNKYDCTVHSGHDHTRR
jgi:hypothetical protein